MWREPPPVLEEGAVLLVVVLVVHSSPSLSSESHTAVDTLGWLLLSEACTAWGRELGPRIILVRLLELSRPRVREPEGVPLPSRRGHWKCSALLLLLLAPLRSWCRRCLRRATIQVRRATAPVPATETTAATTVLDRM